MSGQAQVLNLLEELRRACDLTHLFISRDKDHASALLANYLPFKDAMPAATVRGDVSSGVRVRRQEWEHGAAERMTTVGGSRQ